VDCPDAGTSSVVINDANRFCPESESIAPCQCVNHGLEPNGSMALFCDNLNLNDEEASHILTSFISNNSDFSFLRVVSFKRNLLTRIPHEIRHFPRLTQMNFGNNQIDTIRAVDFNFTSPIIYNHEIVLIFLYSNKINYIEPGAFDGKRCVNTI